MFVLSHCHPTIHRAGAPGFIQMSPAWIQLKHCDGTDKQKHCQTSHWHFSPGYLHIYPYIHAYIITYDRAENGEFGCCTPETTWYVPIPPIIMVRVPCQRHHLWHTSLLLAGMMMRRHRPRRPRRTGKGTSFEQILAFMDWQEAHKAGIETNENVRVDKIKQKGKMEHRLSSIEDRLDAIVEHLKRK